jgi:hypothetical protein
MALSPAKGESVTHVSGMECYPSVRKYKMEAFGFHFDIGESG